MTREDGYMVAIITTRNGEKAIHIGMKILKAGGSALDAVEETIKFVEDDPRVIIRLDTVGCQTSWEKLS